MSGRKENPHRYYRSLLLRSPAQFLDALASNIMQGPSCRDNALIQIELLVNNDMTDLLEKHRVNEDESLLQLAAIFHGDVEVMERLGTACPRLLLHQRQGDYEGQTVLHTVVSKQNVPAAQAILQHPRLKEKWIILNGKAVGPRFVATVLMGELPLSVAALTFNLEMVDLLLSHGARIHATNSQGDTVFHTLVRFAELYPEKTDDVAHMLREIHKRLQSPPESSSSQLPAPQAEPKAVWLMENKEGMTALRLAAWRAQPALFKLILSLEGVYCQLDQHDGLFDSLLYDVTEIDPVANKRWHNVNVHARRRNEVSPVRAEGIPSPAHLRLKEVGCCPTIDTPAPSATIGSARGKHPSDGGARCASVLDIICETGRVEKAFEILNTYVVRTIIKSKWQHYKWWFIAWAIIHILLMTLLTVYAIFKARVISSYLAPPPPLPSSANTTTTNTPGAVKSEEAFVNVAAFLTLPLSVLVVFWEVMRLWRGQPLNLWLIHHNGLYRIELVVFAISLILDTLWYLIVGPENNHFLVLALLVGWWFTTFFLRPWKKFSFFTVMLQKVLLGDMLRFSAIILLMLLAYSVAMYITYLPSTAPLPDEFEHLGVTFLTMFNLMLGLTELGVLYSAPHPWLAILLFIFFTLLTYLIMLNALIAMMSNTCSLVSENKVSQWELQRLSVVLLLESMLPGDCLTYNSGRPMHVARYDLRRKQMIQEVRFFTKVNSVQTDYSDGRAILKRKSMLQTERFDDIHAVMASINSNSHIDLLASFTHQHALLHGGHVFEGKEGQLPALQEEEEDSFKTYQQLQQRQELQPYDAGKKQYNPVKGPYDTVKKPENFAAYRKRMAAESERQETSYATTRQKLLTHFMAAQFSSELAQRHMQPVADDERDGKENDGYISDDEQQADHYEEEKGGRHYDNQHLQDARFGYHRDDQPFTPRDPSRVGYRRDNQPYPSRDEEMLALRSPSTPQAVYLHDRQYIPRLPISEDLPALRAQKPKRKRHNSEKTASRRKLPSGDPRAKTMYYPQRDKGTQIHKSLSEGAELPVLRAQKVSQSDESVAASQHSLQGHHVLKPAPNLPTPEVFVISPKLPEPCTEA